MAYSGAYRPSRPPVPQPPDRPRQERPPQRPPDKLAGALEGLMRKIESIELETDDLIMALILYLMYRESGDKDLLIMLGAMLLT